MTTIEVVAIVLALIGELVLMSLLIRHGFQKMKVEMIEYTNRPLLAFDGKELYGVSLLDDMNRDNDVYRFYHDSPKLNIDWGDSTEEDEGITRPLPVVQPQLDPMDLNSWAGFMNGEIDLDANPDMSNAAGVFMEEERKRREGK